MKRFFRILLITPGVILLLLILIPLIFRSRIESLVKEQVNRSVVARVDWSRFSMDLFRGFPELSINLHGLSVVGLEPFEGDTLAALERFELRASPFSALRGRLAVHSIILDRPLIQGIVLEDGRANWDIVPAGEVTEGEEGKAAEEAFGEPATGPEALSGGSMKVSLKRLAIRDGKVLYRDETLGAEAALGDLDLELKGDFSMDRTDLDLAVGMAGIDAVYSGIRYMRGGELALDLVAAADLVNHRYTLQQNELRLNGLILGAEGRVVLLDGGAMELDLSFFSKETSFRTLLSMVPAIYLQDFSDLRTSGNLRLEGTVKGVMKDSILPDATLLLEVSDGTFSYPGLPGEVSDVQIRLGVDYRGTDMDLTTVDLSRFHFLAGGNPFDLRLQVSHPVSDMRITGNADGTIDFATLADALPLEDIRMQGRLQTDLAWDTRLSFIENERFEEVDLDGSLVLEGILVETPELPVPVSMTRMEMDFNPRYVRLVTLDLVLGSSDLHLEGELRNFIPYLFADGTVSGNLIVRSDLLDVNQLMPPAAENDTAGTEEAVELAPPVPDSLAEPAGMKIPENMVFNLDLDLGKVIYDRITVENIRGGLGVNGGVADLRQLEMEILEGRVMATGKVDTRPEFTEADLELDMQGVDIPASYETFVTVKRLAPMARYCRGTANVKMDYRSQLDASFNPLYGTIHGSGRIFTRGLQVYNLNTFVRLSELLKTEKFRQMAPDEVDIAFRVRDGRVMVDPFDIDFDDSRIIVSGSHGIDLTMDYLLDMRIARSDLGPGASEAMNMVSALAGGAGINIAPSETLKVKARVTGTFREPRITTDLSENLVSTGQAVRSAVEEKVTEEVQKVEEQVRDEVSEKAEEMIRRAEEEAAKLVEEARERGDQLVREAEVQGENLIREAGNNPIRQAAARRAAAELKEQAQKQSDNLVREAEEKAASLVEKAREEAGRYVP